jgi:hypothetical protein
MTAVLCPVARCRTACDMPDTATRDHSVFVPHDPHCPWPWTGAIGAARMHSHA